MITELILAILLCLLVIDITLVGVTPRLFKIWPDLNIYIKGRGILFSTVVYSYRTNLSHSLYHSQAAYRIHILKFLISENWIIIRNTMFTCLPPINILDIENYEVKNGFIGYKVFFNLKDGENYFRIRITGIEKLEEILEGLNILKHSR